MVLRGSPALPTSKIFIGDESSLDTERRSIAYSSKFTLINTKLNIASILLKSLTRLKIIYQYLITFHLTKLI